MSKLELYKSCCPDVVLAEVVNSGLAADRVGHAYSQGKAITEAKARSSGESVVEDVLPPAHFTTEADKGLHLLLAIEHDVTLCNLYCKFRVIRLKSNILLLEPLDLINEEGRLLLDRGDLLINQRQDCVVA